ncbi:hypothetical protein AYI68_g4299 [Smittium mucronatum]|nr:hypothetical protein AYI68_g4299 [Smittium mucronatum]
MNEGMYVRDNKTGNLVDCETPGEGLDRLVSSSAADSVSDDDEDDAGNGGEPPTLMVPPEYGPDDEDTFLLDFFTPTDQLDGFDPLVAQGADILGDDGLVDFELGVSYFLSAEIMRDALLEQGYDLIGGLVTAWLNFLVAHQRRLGLLAYTDNLERALDVSAKSEFQVPVIYKVSGMFPDPFNKACYDYFYFGSDESAMTNVNWMLGNEELGIFVEKFKGSTVTKKEAVDLRVLQTFGPGQFCLKVQEYDRKQSQLAEGSIPFLLYFGHSSGGLDEEDTDTIPELCFPNLYIECTLHTLSNGSKFISDVSALWPSFAPLDYHLF